MALDLERDFFLRHMSPDDDDNGTGLFFNRQTPSTPSKMSARVVSAAFQRTPIPLPLSTSSQAVLGAALPPLAGKK